MERVALPFQVVETINVSRATREETPLFSSGNLIEDPLFAQCGANPSGADGWRNKLIWGDNKYVLASLLEGDPAIGLESLAGKVDLIYIDPPFDTGDDFSFRLRVGDAELAKEPSIIEERAYRDMWGDGRDFGPYLQMMYDRLVLMRELLSPEGTIYVHQGPNVSHYIKAVLDEIFGQERFLNEVIWKRQTAHSDIGQGAQHMGRLHDTIYLYTKSDRFTWNMQYTDYDEEYKKDFYKHIEPETGRAYQLGDLTAPGGAAKGNPHFEFLGITRYWRFSKERMEQLLKEGRIVQTKPGAVPRLKRYLDEMPGVPLQDMWVDVPPVQSQSAERLGYDTQKPEALLERIIKLSSNEGRRRR